MAQQWFVKTKAGSAGPFSSRKLKELVRQDKVKSKSAISPDGKKWIRADNVKGLFDPAPIEESEEIPVAEVQEDNSLENLDLGSIEGLGTFPTAIPTSATKLIAIREKAFQERFGPFESVSHPLGPGQPHIDVYVHAATKERPFATLVTGGMSDHAMPVPPPGNASTRCELMMYVDEPDELYINLLRFLASQPYAQNTWFSYGSTMNNGNPPQPIFEGSVLDHYLFMMPFVDGDFEIQESVSIEGAPLQLLWVVPITTAERQLIIEQGMEGFFPLVDKHMKTITVDPGRKCFAKKRGWFR